MLSNIDKLLLSSAQQAELRKMKRAWQTAQAAGDTQGMAQAHAAAESLRAAAGYSGGEAGDRYRLLQAANAPAGFKGYQTLLEQPVNTAMYAIATGYQSQLDELDRQREVLKAEGKQNRAAARSAAWNTQRMAADGLLTRGLSDTGIADVITATALNQAAANAYQALLDSQNDLKENDTARAAAKADALNHAAGLQTEVGAMLGEAYADFYRNETELEHELNKLAQDYYYRLALQRLK